MLRYSHGDHPVLDWSEIQKHTTRQDCWLVVKNVVLDVTKFIPFHPAGAQSILRHAGTDSTIHYEFHSRGAQKLWLSKCQIVGFCVAQPTKS